MQNFKIRLGKALNLIKNEGVINGIGKVFRYLLIFIKSLFMLEKGDILFIANGVGDSARYRTRNVAEELELNGFKCSVTVQDNPRLLRLADNYKIFIFHKTLYTERVERFIEKIKKQNKEIIFDADDLLFDPGFIKKTDYYQKINDLEKGLYAKGLGGEFVVDSYVKTCTTTTSYLANKFRERGKEVFVVPNKLSDKDLEIVKKIQNTKYNIQDTKIRIGYFSGTKSHDRDFAQIEDTLIEIMKKYSNVELVLAGPLEISEKFSNFENRIKRLAFAERLGHFENISSVDINIVPLEIGDPFCESKSELKFFEAGILGVPTVAAATQTFREAIADGIDGFVARDYQEWFSKLEKMILDANLRAAMGERARLKSLEKYSNKKSHSQAYYGYLKKILDA